MPGSNSTYKESLSNDSLHIDSPFVTEFTTAISINHDIPVDEQMNLFEGYGIEYINYLGIGEVMVIGKLDFVTKDEVELAFDNWAQLDHIVESKDDLDFTPSFSKLDPDQIPCRTVMINDRKMKLMFFTRKTFEDLMRGKCHFYNYLGLIMRLKGEV